MKLTCFNRENNYLYKIFFIKMQVDNEKKESIIQEINRTNDIDIGDNINDSMI